MHTAEQGTTINNAISRLCGSELSSHQHSTAYIATLKAFKAAMACSYISDSAQIALVGQIVDKVLVIRGSL